MAREYAAQGVKFIFVYTREAHPGEHYPHLMGLEQKLQHARDMVVRDSIARPMLVDDLEGTLHHAYGRLPNMSYVIGGGGKIVYRAAWTDSDNLRLVLERIVRGRSQRRAGTEQRPYYVEWEATRTADPRGFVEVLLETAGPKAVGEFIESVGHMRGEGAVKDIRSWWESRRNES